MIELPDFSKPFYYENNYYLSSDIYRMAKVMAHYDLFKLTVDVPGSIVECGVFKGASFVRFAAFRQLLCNALAKKMIGFDAFGPFPETEFEHDLKWREKFIKDSGDEGIGEDQLMQVLKHKKCDENVELVKGDVCKTIPAYLEKHPELKISFLNIDVDVFEPTHAVLDYLYPKVTRGGVILLDDYANVFPGANKAIDDYFADKDVEIKRLPYAVTPCYLIKK